MIPQRNAPQRGVNEPLVKLSLSSKSCTSYSLDLGLGLSLIQASYLDVYRTVLVTLKLPLVAAAVGGMFAGSAATALFVFDVACGTPDQSGRRRRRCSVTVDVHHVWTRRAVDVQRSTLGGMAQRRCPVMCVQLISLQRLRDREILIKV